MAGYFKYLLVLAAVFSAFASAGQGKKNYFAFMLGADTVGYEEYVRFPDKIEADIVTFSPATIAAHFRANINPEGFITQFDYYSKYPAAEKKLSERKITIQNDSVHQWMAFSGKVNEFFTRSFAVRPGSIPHFDYDVSMYEQMVLQLKKSGQDSIAFDKISNAAMHNYIKRTGTDEYQTRYFFYPVIVKTDAAGAVTSFDATASTIKITAVAIPPFSFAGLVAAHLKKDSQKGPSGAFSPADTLRATLKGTDLQITYSRPLRRGRVIFGNVVPWGQVWRTGANFATQLSTTKDLTFGDFILPAGKYTLWTLPNPAGAKLIISKAVNIFGTQYNPKNDLVRLDMVKTALPQVIEKFTIDIKERPTGGRLILAWDSTAYSIEFDIK